MVAAELALEQQRAQESPSTPPLETLAHDVEVESDRIAPAEVAPSAKWRATKEQVVKGRDPRRDDSEPPSPETPVAETTSATITLPPPASWDPMKIGGGSEG